MVVRCACNVWIYAWSVFNLHRAHFARLTLTSFPPMDAKGMAALRVVLKHAACDRDRQSHEQTVLINEQSNRIWFLQRSLARSARSFDGQHLALEACIQAGMDQYDIDALSSFNEDVGKIDSGCLPDREEWGEVCDEAWMNSRPESWSERRTS